MKWYSASRKDNFFKRLRRKLCQHKWEEFGRADIQGELWTNLLYQCAKCQRLRGYY